MPPVILSDHDFVNVVEFLRMWEAYAERPLFVPRELYGVINAAYVVRGIDQPRSIKPLGMIP
jgi:hypothetical protein